MRSGNRKVCRVTDNHRQVTGKLVLFLPVFLLSMGVGKAPSTAVVQEPSSTTSALPTTSGAEASPTTTGAPRTLTSTPDSPWPHLTVEPGKQGARVHVSTGPGDTPGTLLHTLPGEAPHELLWLRPKPPDLRHGAHVLVTRSVGAPRQKRARIYQPPLPDSSGRSDNAGGGSPDGESPKTLIAAWESPFLPDLEVATGMASAALTLAHTHQAPAPAERVQINLGLFFHKGVWTESPQNPLIGWKGPLTPGQAYSAADLLLSREELNRARPLLEQAAREGKGQLIEHTANLTLAELNLAFPGRNFEHSLGLSREMLRTVLEEAPERSREKSRAWYLLSVLRKSEEPGAGDVGAYLLARYYLETVKAPERARKAAQSALERFRRSPVEDALRIVVARSLAMAGQTKEALEEYRLVLKFFPASRYKKYVQGRVDALVQ